MCLKEDASRASIVLLPSLMDEGVYKPGEEVHSAGGVIRTYLVDV